MPRRATLVLGAVAVVAVIVVACLYVAREKIAVSLARQWLAEHGAASAVELEHLNLTGFSAKVRLGDPSDPDLTVDHMEVRYALSGPWTGEGFDVHTRSIVLIRPRLTARLINGHVTFGALDGLIRALEQLPPTKDPIPDLTVREGEARLVTPGGVVRLHGAGSLRAGASLTALQAQVDPFHLTLGPDKIDSAGGVISVESIAGRLHARADFGASAYASAAAAASVSGLRLSADAPYPSGSQSWSGPTQASLDAAGVAGRLGQSVLSDASLGADFQGTLDAAGAKQSARGTLHVSAQIGSATAPGGAARIAAAEGAFSRLELVHDDGGLSLRASADATAAIGAIDAPGARLTAVSTALHSGDLRLTANDGASSVSGVIQGSLTGRGSASPPAGDFPYAPAVRSALKDFRFAAPDWRLRIAGRRADLSLIAPLALTTASGGRASLTGQGGATSLSPLAASGAASLSLAGGGLPALKIDVKNATVGAAGASANLVAQGALDAVPAKDARFEVAGRATMGGGQTRFDLAGCAPVTIARIAVNGATITGAAARLCPAAGPLIVAGPTGWRANGRFDTVQGDMAEAMANVRDAAGAFEAAGAAKGLASAALTLDRVQINDTANSARFEPLVASGRIDVAQGVAVGRFDLATTKKHAVATVDLKHGLASGVGRADIRADSLVFAPGALQPTDLTPLAAVARNANGPVHFAGFFTWGPGAPLTSGGEASARDFKFASPLGPVTGLNADIRFTSLAPLTTAPGQVVSVKEIQALLPVSALAAHFGLGSENLSLETATGAMAKGHIRLEPMSLGFGPDASFKGAVVFDHVNLGEILAATSLSDTVKADAVVDGRIPFEVGPNGVTIQQGHLAAVGPGRVSLSRKALSGVAASGGAAPAGQADFAQDLAYQAMENLAFDQLEANVNSLAHDRLGMIFHIKGRHDPPTRQKASIAVKDIIGGHALDKPFTLPSDTKIDLTLDTSLNFGDLVKAIGQAWRDSLARSGPQKRSAPVQGSAPNNASK